MFSPGEGSRLIWEHDEKLVEASLEGIPVERPEPNQSETQGMCLDKGYDYDETRELVREFGFTAPQEVEARRGRGGPPLGGGTGPQRRVRGSKLRSSPLLFGVSIYIATYCGYCIIGVWGARCDCHWSSASIPGMIADHRRRELGREIVGLG
jgi:hypothetical protein